MQWYNEPPIWTTQDDAITVVTGPKTDFWRKTHYDFIRDNGHFYFEPVTGDFVAEVKVTGAYAALYDQAGLMLRADETTWMKCGIEFVGDVQQASVVVTRDHSDWSVVPLIPAPPAFWIRVRRTGGAIEVQYSRDGQEYSLLRLAYLSEAQPLQIGLMCASPQGDGFPVSFERFAIRGDGG